MWLKHLKHHVFLVSVLCSFYFLIFEYANKELDDYMKKLIQF